MSFLSNATLIMIILIVLARLPEIVPGLYVLQLGKLFLALGLLLALTRNANTLLAGLRKTPLGNYILLITFLGFISIPFSVWPGGAFEGFLGYSKTVIVFSVVVALAMHGREHILRLAITGSVIILSLLMVAERGAEGRLQVSQTYDPNDIALLFVVFLPLTVVEALKGPKAWRLFAWVGVVCSLIGIALTQSRGGVLALAAISVHGLFMAKGKRWLLIPLLVAGAVLFYSMADNSLWERFQSVRDESDYNFTSGGGRLIIWTEGIKLMLHNPLGVGISQFGTGLGTEGHGLWKAAHNSFVEIGAELGIGGLLALILLLWQVRKISLRGIRTVALPAAERLRFYALLTGLTGFCVGGSLLSQAYGNILYILFSLAAVMHLQLERAESSAREAQHQAQKPEPEQSEAAVNLGRLKPAPGGLSSVPSAKVSIAQKAKHVRQSRESRLEQGDRLRRQQQHASRKAF